MNHGEKPKNLMEQCSFEFVFRWLGGKQPRKFKPTTKCWQPEGAVLEEGMRVGGEGTSKVLTSIDCSSAVSYLGVER